MKTYNIFSNYRVFQLEYFSSSSKWDWILPEIDWCRVYEAILAPNSDKLKNRKTTSQADNLKVRQS